MDMSQVHFKGCRSWSGNSFFSMISDNCTYQRVGVHGMKSTVLNACPGMYVAAKSSPGPYSHVMFITQVGSGTEDQIYASIVECSHTNNHKDMLLFWSYPDRTKIDIIDIMDYQAS